MAADFRNFRKCPKILIISELLDRVSVLPKITTISEFSEQLLDFETPVFLNCFGLQKTGKTERPGKSKGRKAEIFFPTRVDLIASINGSLFRFNLVFIGLTKPFFSFIGLLSVYISITK